MAHPLIIPLSWAKSDPISDKPLSMDDPQFLICGDTVCGSGTALAGDSREIMKWFTAAVGTPCQLVRQQSGERTAVLQRKGGKNGKRNSPGDRGDDFVQNAGGSVSAGVDDAEKALSSIGAEVLVLVPKS